MSTIQGPALYEIIEMYSTWFADGAIRFAPGPCCGGVGGGGGGKRSKLMSQLRCKVRRPIKLDSSLEWNGLPPLYSSLVVMELEMEITTSK